MLRVFSSPLGSDYRELTRTKGSQSKDIYLHRPHTTHHPTHLPVRPPEETSVRILSPLIFRGNESEQCERSSGEL